MPRKAPTQITEQRIALGTFERQLLTETKQDAISLVKRRQNFELAEKMALPLTIGVVGIAGIFVISNTWQKVNDLIPSFDGVLDGLSNVIHGDEATKEAIVKDATEKAAQDGKPLSFWQKARNRFAFDAFRFGGGVY